MRLIEWVKNLTQNGLQAETTVTEAWPLNKDGGVSSLICIELVAQAISALSTWRRGEEARPRIGLLVGIKEAEFFCFRIPVMTRLIIQINELYHVGGYAVFQGKVSSELALFCKTIIQVMEPEEETLSNIVTSQRIDSWEKE
jgi:predicted hotdog family 3-hydroxylacyl-ACP dehydratase